jgi:arsenate reductase (thioredoxin)
VKKEKSPAPGASPSKRTQVLFVCVGNACRSPMAEAIARYDGLDVIEPSSAGLFPLGYIAELTKQTLMKNGYSANELTSNGLTREAVDAADLIINMTGKSFEEILRANEKVEDWLVQDPYGADPETYQRVFEAIQRRVNQLARILREKRMSTKATR